MNIREECNFGILKLGGLGIVGKRMKVLRDEEKPALGRVCYSFFSESTLVTPSTEVVCVFSILFKASWAEGIVCWSSSRSDYHFTFSTEDASACCDASRWDWVNWISICVVAKDCVITRLVHLFPPMLFCRIIGFVHLCLGRYPLLPFCYWQARSSLIGHSCTCGSISKSIPFHVVN